MPLLLQELVEIGKITPADIKNNFQKIAESLPDFFVDIPESKRMAIVAKYATKTSSELYDLGKKVMEKYELSFDD